MNKLKLFSKHEQEMMAQVYQILRQGTLFDPEVANLFGVNFYHLRQTVDCFQDHFPGNFIIHLSGKGLVECRRTPESPELIKIETPVSIMAFTTQGLLMLIVHLKSPKAEFFSIEITEIVNLWHGFLGPDRVSLCKDS